MKVTIRLLLAKAAGKIFCKVELGSRSKKILFSRIHGFQWPAARSSLDCTDLIFIGKQNLKVLQLYFTKCISTSMDWLIFGCPQLQSGLGRRCKRIRSMSILIPPWGTTLCTAQDLKAQSQIGSCLSQEFFYQWRESIYVHCTVACWLLPTRSKTRLVSKM